MRGVGFCTEPDARNHATAAAACSVNEGITISFLCFTDVTD